MDKNQSNQGQQDNYIDNINQTSNTLKSNFDKLKNVRKGYKALRKARAAASATRTGVTLAQGGGAIVSAASTGEVWGPLLVLLIILVLLVVIIASLIAVVTGGPNAIAGNICAGKCQTSACQPPNIQDSTGAKCENSATPICCVPQPPCIGTCETGTTCSKPTDNIDPTAYCNGGASQVCCIPPGTLPSFHYYCQYDPKYTSSSCNITVGGCDPTSIAMIVTSFGNTYTPVQVAKSNGSMGCTANGTTFAQTSGALNNWVAPMGYTIAEIGVSSSKTVNFSAIKSKIDAGYYIVALACMTFKSGSSTSKGGHSIVITGYNSNGSLKVADPTYCSTDNNVTPRTLDPTYPGADIKSLCCDTNGNNCWSGWGALYAVKKP